MRGYLALTRGWERPIQPCAEPARPTPRVRRPRLLEPDVRKVLFDLDVIAQRAQNEIRKVFEKHGLDREQQAQQMRRIRRDRG